MDDQQGFHQDLTVDRKSKPTNEIENKKKKICEICGDFSLGHNFGVITCESCKAFFRRNALRLKVKILFENILLIFLIQEFTCPFEGNCSIDCITRRFCQKCRMNKCLSIGMKKEWIRTENEKNYKRKKRIDSNRL